MTWLLSILLVKANRLAQMMNTKPHTVHIQIVWFIVKFELCTTESLTVIRFKEAVVSESPKQRWDNGILASLLACNYPSCIG